MPATRQVAWTAVGRTVIFLGITSLLTDISAEMVSAVLPLYMLYQLQASPLQLGIVDGIYQGISGLVRLGAGLVGDRWRRPKGLAAGGLRYASGGPVRLLCIPGFRKLVIAAGLLTLFTVSDAFIYIGLQRQGSFDLGLFPLLYVGTASFYLLLALPAGGLADRIGRRRLYLAGQLLMLG